MTAGIEERQGNPVFGRLGTTIFTVMSGLAAECGAINLGQGFPDEDGPQSVRERAARALLEGPNQYAPSSGEMELRKAIAAHAQRFYGLKFDPASEVLVTSGATEALTDCIWGLIAPGDEAVLIEPSYDSYRPMLEAAGAIIKSVRLTPPHFSLDLAALEEAFTPRTKLIVLNTPCNPAGHVFSRAELDAIAALLTRHNAFAICDEVYEHLVFDGLAHIPLITLPGMRDRCLRVGSAGKMFSLTGWKIGWIAGPARLINLATKAHQFNTFTTSPALQLGVAHGLNNDMEFSLNLTRALQEKRDLLADVLARLGFDVTKPQGTYFLTAGISKITNEADREFCIRMTREAGVTAIPLSAFYESDAPTDLVRFAFCKKPEILRDAASRLSGHFAKPT